MRSLFFLLLAVAPLGAATPLPTDLVPLTRPTIHILGDATAKNSGVGKNGRPMAGWGDALAEFLDPAKVTLANAARAGQSSRTFFNEPSDWQAVSARLNRGDLVLIVFGLHDNGPPYAATSRGSVPGIDDETKDLTRSDGSIEKARSYGWYLSTMATEAREKGARVYLLTVVPRNIWRNPRVEFRDATPAGPLPADYDRTRDQIERGNADGQYTLWTNQIGRRINVPVLDLTNLCADVFEQTGREKVDTYFADHNQLTVEGARAVAAVVVSGLKSFPASPFTALLSDKGRAVRTGDPRYVHANPAPVR